MKAMWKDIMLETFSFSLMERQVPRAQARNLARSWTPCKARSSQYTEGHRAQCVGTCLNS